MFDNKRKTLKRTMAVAIAVGAALATVASALAVSYPLVVVVDGSTTVYPITSAAVAQFQAQNPDTTISFPNGSAQPGSGTGISELCGTAASPLPLDIAESSRNISASDCTNMDDWIVAHDGIIPVVNTASLGFVTDLTKQNLADIYDCNKRFWDQINPTWPHVSIVPIARETSSGTYASFISLVGSGLTNANEGTCIDTTVASPRQLGNPDVQTYVSSHANTIGYVGIGFETFQGLNDVTVNGIHGTSTTILNNTYPLSRVLHMLTIQYASNQRLATYSRGIDFVNYILSSSGQQFVSQAGFIPLGVPQTIPNWDTNVDGFGNINDIVTIGQAWQQSQPGHAGWIRADVNRDASVDINDIVTIGQHWQGTWSKWTG